MHHCPSAPRTRSLRCVPAWDAPARSPQASACAVLDSQPGGCFLCAALLGPYLVKDHFQACWPSCCSISFAPCTHQPALYLTYLFVFLVRTWVPSKRDCFACCLLCISEPRIMADCSRTSVHIYRRNEFAVSLCLSFKACQMMERLNLHEKENSEHFISLAK